MDGEFENVSICVFEYWYWIADQGNGENGVERVDAIIDRFSVIDQAILDTLFSNLIISNH